MSIQFHGNVQGFERGMFYDVMGKRQNGGVLVRSQDGQFRTLNVKDSRSFQAFQKQDMQIAQGDQIRITGNGKTLEGQTINNGECHTIEGFDQNGNIQLSNGQSVSKDYGNFALGYYSTSHASQGQDAQDIFVVQSSRSFIASSDKQFYVSVSRGEESIKIYTDDKDGLKSAVMKSGNRMMAMEVAEQTLGHQFNKRQIIESKSKDTPKFEPTETPKAKSKDEATLSKIKRAKKQYQSKRPANDNPNVQKPFEEKRKPKPPPSIEKKKTKNRDFDFDM